MQMYITAFQRKTTDSLKQKCFYNKSYRKPANRNILILTYTVIRLVSRRIGSIYLPLPEQGSQTVQKKATHNTVQEL